nr:transposase [Streptomyces spiramyceticus]
MSFELVHLIAQWPEGHDEPVKYWISNLPADIPTRDLVRLAKSRRRIEHDYRELKTTLGLDHFEGRSFTGWRRHVTLVTAAHLFLTEQRTCPKAPARPDSLSGPGPAPAPPGHLGRQLSHLPTTQPMAALRHDLTKLY